MRPTEFLPFQQDNSSYSHGGSDDEVPDWRLIKPFGAGLKRKRVTFVPASTNTEAPGTTSPLRSGRAGTEVSNLYLTLVGLGPISGNASTSASIPAPVAETCSECALPILDIYNHNTSTAHQSSLPHSHPPHPYNRSSLGLKVLTESGWDPDARIGLGRTGEGVRYPIKSMPKDDKLGVGIKSRKGGLLVKVEKKRKIGAKEARMIEEGKNARRMKLMGELGNGMDIEKIMSSKMD